MDLISEQKNSFLWNALSNSNHISQRHKQVLIYDIYALIYVCKPHMHNIG